MIERYGDGMIVGTFHTGPNGKKIFYGCWDEKGERVLPANQPKVFKGEMSGNAVLVGRAVVQKIGIFSEKFRHSLADNDYARMARRAGFVTCCASSILGWCEPNHGGDKKQLLSMTLIQRIRVFYSVKGIDLPDYLLYKRRHWGLLGYMLSWSKAWGTILVPGLFLK